MNRSTGGGKKFLKYSPTHEKESRKYPKGEGDFEKGPARTGRERGGCGGGGQLYRCAGKASYFKTKDLSAPGVQEKIKKYRKESKGARSEIQRSELKERQTLSKGSRPGTKHYITAP